MLYTFQHGGSLRTFGFVLPPDWFDHVPLPLFVLLHGENNGRRLPDGSLQGAVAHFIQQSKVHLLLQNDVGLVPRVSNLGDQEKPKFAALFPEGISPTEALGGGWQSGHLSRHRYMDLDDVEFVIACVDRLEALLRARFIEHKGVRVQNIFDATRRYAAGFSQGGQMCYKLAAEVPGYFRAIAVHSATPAGWEYTWQQQWHPGVVLVPAGFVADPEYYPRPPDDGCAVLHIHSDTDRMVPFDGAPVVTTQGYFPFGDTTYDRLDASLTDPEFGVEALWATGTLRASLPLPPLLARLYPLDLGNATLSASGVSAVFGSLIPPDVSALLLVVTPLGAIPPGDEGDALSHGWATNNPANDAELGPDYGFDAIVVMWNFFQTLP